jgi:hypothetical protein
MRAADGLWESVLHEELQSDSRWPDKPAPLAVQSHQLWKWKDSTVLPSTKIVHFWYLWVYLHTQGYICVPLSSRSGYVCVFLCDLWTNVCWCPSMIYGPMCSVVCACTTLLPVDMYVFLCDHWTSLCFLCISLSELGASMCEYVPLDCVGLSLCICVASTKVNMEPASLHSYSCEI